MKRESNNPTNFRIRQSGVSEKSYSTSNDPLGDREQELEGEINSPTIPALYNRTLNITNESRGTDGTPSVNKGSYNPGGERGGGQQAPPETWDDPKPMTEDNVRMKFVSMGVEPIEEPMPYNYNNPTY